MKKLILSSIMIAPLFLSPAIFNGETQNAIQETYKIQNEKAIVYEKITEDDVAESSDPTDGNDFYWIFSLKNLMENLSINYIDSIKIYEQEVNFKYNIEWKERGFMDIPDYNWNELLTMEGPGDANGHTGWDEADLDGHAGDGHVIFQDKTLSFGVREKIASGWTVTYYDEYLDDGYGWEDNGSGYHWEDYSIYAQYYLDAEYGYSIKIDWHWESTMTYDVEWDEVNNSDGVLDTIGEFAIGIVF